MDGIAGPDGVANVATILATGSASSRRGRGSVWPAAATSVGPPRCSHLLRSFTNPSLQPHGRAARPLAGPTGASATVRVACPAAKRPQSSRGGLMRSFTWLSPAWALGHIRSWIERVRRSPVARQPAVRWGWPRCSSRASGSLAYLGSTAVTTAESSYLGSGRRYGSEDLAKIGRALDRVRVVLSGRRSSAGLPSPRTSASRPRRRSPSSSSGRVCPGRSATGCPRPRSGNRRATRKCARTRSRRRSSSR